MAANTWGGEVLRVRFRKSFVGAGRGRVIRRKGTKDAGGTGGGRDETNQSQQNEASRGV